MFIVRVCLLNSCWKTCCELFQYLAAVWCTVEGRKCLNWNTEYGCHLLRSVSINDLKHLDNINNTSCEAWLDELEKYYMKWVFLLFWASPLAASSTKSPHWLFSICACVRTCVRIFLTGPKLSNGHHEETMCAIFRPVSQRSRSRLEIEGYTEIVEHCPGNPFLCRIFK